MHFAVPIWLWGCPLVLLWGLGWGFALVGNYRRRQKRYTTAASALLEIPAWAMRAKLFGHGLLTAALVCLLAALARPQGHPVPGASARQGVNLAILVDGSRSMLCEDVLPSRLQVARQAVEAIATAATGSRFSLFMFGGDPTLLIPQTFDTAAVTLAARSISPDFIGKGGTALGPAIKRAADYLARAGKQPKVILIISDGEEGEGDPVLTALQAKLEQQVRIHTITVGTTTGGPMPVYQRAPSGELVRTGDLLGFTQQPVLTHANPELMGKLAEAAGGRSLQLTPGEVTAQVTRFVQQAILPEAVVIDDVATEEPRDWFWVPLLLAGGLMLGEQAMRRWTARRFAGQAPLARGAILRMETPQ